MIVGKQIKQLNQKYFDNYMKNKPCHVWGKVLDCWEACDGSFLADFLEAGNYSWRLLQNIVRLRYFCWTVLTLWQDVRNLMFLFVSKPGCFSLPHSRLQPPEYTLRERVDKFNFERWHLNQGIKTVKKLWFHEFNRELINELKIINIFKLPFPLSRKCNWC